MLRLGRAPEEMWRIARGRCRGYEPWGVGGGRDKQQGKHQRETQGKVSPDAGWEKRHWYSQDRELSPNNEQIPNKLVLFKAEPGVHILLQSSKILTMISQTLVQVRSSGPETVEIHVLGGARTERLPALELLPPRILPSLW